MAEREEINQQPEAAPENSAENVSSQAANSFMSEVNDDRARMSNESLTNSANNSLDNGSSSGSIHKTSESVGVTGGGGGGGGGGSDFGHASGAAQSSSREGVLAKEMSGKEGSSQGMDNQRNGGPMNSMDKEALIKGASDKEAQIKGSGDKSSELKGPFEGTINGDKVSDNVAKTMKDPFEKKDGVKELPTGDHLVRKDGNETLFTPNGDSVTVNKDGTVEVKGDVTGSKTDKNGDTTVSFKDGSTVKYDKHGIKDVTRGDKSVHLAHPEDMFNKMKEPIKGGQFPHPRPLPGGEGPKPNPGDGPNPHPGDRPPNSLPKPNGEGRPNQGDRPQPRQNLDKSVRTSVQNILPNIEIKK